MYACFSIYSTWSAAMSACLLATTILGPSSSNPVCTMLDFQHNLARTISKRSKQSIGRSTTKSRSLSHTHAHRKVITLMKCADRLETPEKKKDCQHSRSPLFCWIGENSLCKIDAFIFSIVVIAIRMRGSGVGEGIIITVIRRRGVRLC